MIKKVYKYAIPVEKTFKVEMPKYAEILSVQVQDGQPCFWAEVSPNSEPVERTFEIFGTGQDICYDMGVLRKYIGTFQITEGEFLVFHLYERIN